jgi:hypothetical protein
MVTDTDTQPAKRKRSKRKIIVRLLVTLFVLALLVGAGFVAYQMLIGPSEGTIAANIPDKNPQPAAPELEQFEGTYFTFAYPNSYTIQPVTKDDTHNLETHTFIAAGLKHKILTLTVTNLPSGKLEDDTSYYMRSLHPETYTMKPQVIQGDKVVVARSTQDYQQAAFWPHVTKDGGKLLTFSISTVTLDSNNTDQEYQKMLESVRWR